MIPITNGIQKGLKTQSQDQVITPSNLSTINIRPRVIHKLSPSLMFTFLLVDIKFISL